MPSSEIHSSSVTYWRLALSPSKSTSRTIAYARTATVPASARAGPAGRRRSAPRQEAGRGLSTGGWSRADDQEVEGEGGQAEQEQKRITAQEAGLYRAREGGADAHDAGGAANDEALYEVGLDHPPAEGAGGGGGPHEDGVVERVGGPLVLEGGVHGGGAGPA